MITEKNKPTSSSLPPLRLSPPYQAMAEIYDRMMAHVPYARWANYIRRIIREHLSGIPLERSHLLDIGCGTGEFLRCIREQGIRADGCDPSREMLTLARRKNSSSRFWVTGLPELEGIPAGYYQVMTCLYDSINYLSNMEEIKKGLNRIYELLAPPGLFIFDAVSDEFCRSYFHQYSENETFDNDYAYSRQAYYDSARRKQINEIIIYTPHGVYRENHEQYIFSFTTMKYLIIQETPFELIGMYEDFTFYDAEEESNRAHFILKKTT